MSYVLKGRRDSFWVSDSYWYGALKLAAVIGTWEPAGTSLWYDSKPETGEGDISIVETYTMHNNQVFYEADARRFGQALMDALNDVPDEQVDGDNLLQMLSGKEKKKNLERIAQMAIDGEIIIGPMEEK
tara:strand:- start:2967 stop:3353 length:387 start_codon:yes stop_codon:yes gene_type:complete